MDALSQTFTEYLPANGNAVTNAVFPKCHRRKQRTTNMFERINLELKRRTRTVGAFPGDQSLLRLTVSVLMDINEEWLTGRKYLSLEES